MGFCGFILTVYWGNSIRVFNALDGTVVVQKVEIIKVVEIELLKNEIIQNIV